MYKGGLESPRKESGFQEARKHSHRNKTAKVANKTSSDGHHDEVSSVQTQSPDRAATHPIRA